MKHTHYTDILDFWFTELAHEDRFHSGAKMDTIIKERFGDMHARAIACEYWAWRDTAAGSLAEIILLDQFSRNIYRGSAAAFASDGQGLVLAQSAVAKGFDMELDQQRRMFMYLPYMHSESSVIHEEAVKLFTDLGDEEAIQFEHVHKEIIERFGRYPHRNEQLGRESTPEEQKYLSEADHVFFKS